MIGVSAREVSGLQDKLTTGSLIRVRLISVFIAYFMISLFYSLLSRAFQVDFSRKYVLFPFILAALLTSDVKIWQRRLCHILDG